MNTEKTITQVISMPSETYADLEKFHAAALEVLQETQTAIELLDKANTRQLMRRALRRIYRLLGLKTSWGKHERLE